MPEQLITKSQLKRLQTLWGKYARHEMVPNTRDERLRWANGEIRKMTSSRLHGIASFKDLTAAEASKLINTLQSMMGLKESSPAAGTRRFRSRITDRDRAHDAGTEGRRGQRDKHTMASAEDLEMIDRQLVEMEWDRARLDALLKSPSSPLGRNSGPQLRTVGDINRVLWALKRIAKAAKQVSA